MVESSCNIKYKQVSESAFSCNQIKQLTLLLSSSNVEHTDINKSFSTVFNARDRTSRSYSLKLFASNALVPFFRLFLAVSILEQNSSKPWTVCLLPCVSRIWRAIRFAIRAWGNIFPFSSQTGSLPNGMVDGSANSHPSHAYSATSSSDSVPPPSTPFTGFCHSTSNDLRNAISIMSKSATFLAPFGQFSFRSD